MHTVTLDYYVHYQHEIGHKNRFTLHLRLSVG